MPALSAAAGPLRLRRPATGPSLGDRLRQARDELRRTPADLVAGVLVWGVLTGLFRAIDPQGLWWGGAVACAPVWAWRWVLLWRRHAGSAGSPGRVLAWHRANGRWVVVQSFILGAACAAYQDQAEGVALWVLLVVVLAASLGSLPRWARHPRRLWLHAGATLGPMTTVLMLDSGGPHHLSLVGMMALMWAMVLWVGASIESLLARADRLRHRALDLRAELQHQARQADHRRLQAEAELQARIALLAGLSHDIRQPLLALHLQSERAAAGLAVAGRSGVGQALLQGVQAVDRLFSDMLDLMRSDAGALHARPEPVRLGDVYQRLDLQLEPLATARGLHLRWRGGESRLVADPHLLERCLRNLVVNALQHTRIGGVLVAARCRGDTLRVQVWDTGCGIPLHRQQDLLRETGPSFSWRPTGCGLGLLIVRRLAHLMNAQLTLRSRPSRGTVFEIVWRQGGPPCSDHAPVHQAGPSAGSEPGVAAAAPAGSTAQEG